jgi:FMN phosphatase YigB (HAD superfamily)
VLLLPIGVREHTNAAHIPIIYPTVRIAIDVDSTLHHYWDVLSEISLRRFGIELPYEEQFTWGITRLRPDQLAVCIEESHSDETILAGRPYPAAVETVREWSAQGHFIHITSHRATACATATARWLQGLGLPFDDLCCSYDKVSRCVELDVDLLIDDSPLNLIAAIERGIRTATIVHPWNAELCEEEDVIAARDWPELECLLTPLLAAPAMTLAAGR